ncbi:subtilisin-like protein, partial [Saccharata proteae CBS 121410]
SSHASGGDSYVVLVNASHPYPPDVEEVLQRIELSSNHSDVHHIFNNSAFKGFSASMQSHCVDKLLNMSDISHVEKSVSMSSFDTWTRAESPWGLQRVSSTSSISGDVKNLDYTYSFDDSKLGKGVDIYVVDTGVNVDHIAFGGRASNGWTAYPTGGPNNGGWTGSGGNFTDGAGHGTHVSGTAAGSVLGIASGANIIAVRVLDDNGGGATNVTIAGIDWVVNQHEFRKTQPDFVGSILSMSFGTSEVVKTLTDAIAAATAAGIHASVAAGNDGEDACNYSPSNGGGGNSSIVSVGSIGSSNTISSFSNTGACTDIYAPGENVLSCWIGGDNVVQYLDGTSMATPHVTGVMAYMMVQDSSLAEDPAAMKDYLTRSALKNMVTGSVASGGAKLLLNNGVTST